MSEKIKEPRGIMAQFNDYAWSSNWGYNWLSL